MQHPAPASAANWDVVVIGGGICGLSAARELQQAGLRTVVVEKDARLGGKVLTEEVDGFLLEAGPDAFIPHKPWAMEMVRELGLEERLLPSNDSRRTTHIVMGSRLVELPPGLHMLTPLALRPFLASPLLSWSAKWRVLRERWVPGTEAQEDETLASFVRRRMGEEVLERLAEPLLAHIHVGDIERMSLQATYPRLAALEAQWGSLWQGARAQRGKKRTSSSSGQAPPLFWALKGGLRELIRPLAAQTQNTLPGRKVLEVHQNEQGFQVVLEDRALQARGVILALPAFAAADIIQDKTLADLLGEIHSVSIATLSLGYKNSELPKLPQSFGFFVPRREGRNLLAGTWTSAKFDHRAPEGHSLLRVFLGGALHERLLQKKDEEIIPLIRRELDEILGIQAEPVITRLYRWPSGYPQYEVGHPGRVRAIETACPPGLVIAGSAFHGVGLPDCIRSGKRAAQMLRDTLQ